MDSFNSWWITIPLFEKIFWYIAAPFSVLTIIQTILAFIGLGDHDVDTDVHGDVGTDVAHDGHDHHFGDSLKFFTVRNFIIFLTAFGWMGIACTRSGFPKWLVIMVAFIAGVIMIIIVAWVFYMLYKLGESGTFRLQNAIGHSGTVYLPIPPKKQGKGLIQLSVQGATREIDAVTYEEEELQTGINVTVVELNDPTTVTVIKSI